MPNARTADVPADAILSLAKVPAATPNQVAVIMGGRTMGMQQLRGALNDADLILPDSYLAAVLHNTMTNVIGPDGQLLRDSEDCPVKVHRFKMVAPGVFRGATSKDIRQEILREYESRDRPV